MCVAILSVKTLTCGGSGTYVSKFVAHKSLLCRMSLKVYMGFP